MSDSTATVLKKIKKIDNALTEAQKPLQAELQLLLGRLEGQEFGSLEANTDVADAIRFLMLRLEVRVECPRDGCQEPALIRCRPAGRTVNGSFEFEHRLDRRRTTHAGRVRLPKLKLISAPPHRKRKPPK